MGRPNFLPFCRACAKPARTRSRRISLSNSANTASSAAIARPEGVVRSSASVSDTKPTPRWSSSWSVASSSGTDLLHLQGDGPAPPGGIFSQGADLQGDGVLVEGGNAGVEANAKHLG